MISRHWHAIAKRDRAADYVRHLQKETFPAIGRIPGFISASIQRRDGARGVELIIITNWASMEAIRKFAGPDPDIAVVPSVVQAMMVDFDGRVRHYEVVG